MAAGMSAIRKALMARLGTIPDVTPYYFIPDAINAPAMFLEPDKPFADYQKAFQQGQIEWRYLLTILVNRLDEESAQLALDGYLDPSGPVISTLLAPNVGDTLSSISGYVDVLGGERYGAFQVGATTYLGAQLLVVVSA